MANGAACVINNGFETTTPVAGVDDRRIWLDDLVVFCVTHIIHEEPFFTTEITKFCQKSSDLHHNVAKTQLFMRIVVFKDHLIVLPVEDIKTSRLTGDIQLWQL